MKIISVILSATFAFTLLVGCSKTTIDTPHISPPPPEDSGEDKNVGKTRLPPRQ